MSPMNIVSTALRALGSSKLRSGLTLLGIVIGITAVTVMMSIGRSVQSGITSSVQAQGTNLLFVNPGFGASGGAAAQITPLTLEDSNALMDPALAPSVKAVAPEINTFGRVIVGRRYVDASIVGVTPEYASVRNSNVGRGRFITPAHIRSRAEVAVIGSETATDLFGSRNPLGETVRVNGRQFTVVGVLQDTGGAFFGFGDRVYVPITTAYYRLSHERTAQGGVSVDSINVEAVDADSIRAAELEITTILRLRHRIVGANDFEINTLEELLRTLNQITTALVLFLGTVAGISLLVGGIGVMNVMLVSVTERTREIGIRKAMGAKRRDILLQFLTEAVFLTMGGGLIGMLLSLGIVPIIAFFVSQAGDDPGENPLSAIAFQPGVAVLALGVAAGVGLLSGIYPALRASRMHPIDALRYE